VLTLPGSTGVSRAATSILANAGLHELLVDTEDKLVRLAAQLTGDLSRLATLRASLRKRLRSSPLMDAPRFARGFEATCRSMWRNWCATAPD
jgi:predicted O-linked N-acetylglucosamine transferase (SPINDLY family)